MPTTLPATSSASHREELASVRPKPAKADLSAQARASRLRDVAADAIRTVSGNARAAAIDLNIHEGHLSRLLKEGGIRLEQLEVLGPAFAVTFAERLIAEFGPIATPEARMAQLIQQLRDVANEMEQFVAHRRNA